MSPDGISVLLVDDHRVVLEGLELLIGANSDLHVVGSAASMAEAVALARASHPDVVVMDYRLGDGTGADAAVAIRKVQPAIAIVFLSSDDSEEALLAAVRAGACAYLPKSKAGAEVATAIRRAADGETLIPAGRLASLVARIHERERDQAERDRLLEQLTPRETEVLLLMAEGLDNHAISEQLGIGFTTVRGHVQNILEKLDAHSKLEAVARAARAGLLER